MKCNYATYFASCHLSTNLILVQWSTQESLKDMFLQLRLCPTNQNFGSLYVEYTTWLYGRTYDWGIGDAMHLFLSTIVAILNASYSKNYFLTLFHSELLQNLAQDIMNYFQNQVQEAFDIQCLLNSLIYLDRSYCLITSTSSLT